MFTTEGTEGTERRNRKQRAERRPAHMVEKCSVLASSAFGVRPSVFGVFLKSSVSSVKSLSL